jgi:hypothetical protein
LLTEFFRIFDENGLAFLYQDKTASGNTSRFTKFVSLHGDRADHRRPPGKS